MAKTREKIIIAKDGRAVAELRPANKPAKSLFGAHKGMFEIKGDIIEPIDEIWEAEQ